MNDQTRVYNPSITLIKISSLLGIIFFHLELFPMGSQGIIVFVICSGYNYLYLYYKQGGDKRNQKIFLHQLQKLLLALLLVYGITVITDSIFFHQYSVYKIIASYFLIFCGVFVAEILSIINYSLALLGLSLRIPAFPSNAVLWFISLVIWLYLLFPVLFRGMKSKYRFIILLLLFFLSLFVRNYSSFLYPYNSISANLFNFYLGMITYEYEDTIYKKIRGNKEKVVFIMLILLILYMGYGDNLNNILTYGVMIFCCIYILFAISINIVKRINQWLYPINSLIMFLVFLHIPAKSIRDIVLKSNTERAWGYIFLAYFAYFIYTFAIAVMTNKLYSSIQNKLRARSLWI
jgi:hypothetical protein